jgi:hypothetical protein
MLGQRIVNQRLADAVGHRANAVCDRLAKLPRRRKDPLARLHGPIVAKDHCDHRRTVMRQQTGECLCFVRQRGAEVPIEAQDFACLVQRIDHETAQRLRHRMQPVLQRRDGAEIATASPQRPEQIRVFG